MLNAALAPRLRRTPATALLFALVALLLLGHAGRAQAQEPDDLPPAEFVPELAAPEPFVPAPAEPTLWSGAPTRTELVQQPPQVGAERAAEEAPIAAAPGAQPAIEPFAAEDAAAFAPAFATCCRVHIPAISNRGSPAVMTVSALPRLVDGGFDAGGGAWSQTRVQPCDGSEAPFALVTAASTLGNWLDQNFDNEISTPVEATDPNLVWLGGDSALPCTPENPAGLAATDRLQQVVTLPADYGVRLQLDALVQSAESACDHDRAELIVNGVLLPLALPLCTGAEIQQWTERSVDLSAFRGRQVTIEIRLTTDADLNSNLWLDNLALCGMDARLPVADQCPSGGWQEPVGNSAQRTGISNTPGRSYDPSIAVSPIGRPYIAWADNSYDGFGEIYVRRWNGVVWEPVGTGSAGSNGISKTYRAESSLPAVAVSSAPQEGLPAERASIPYVAWQEKSADDVEIYVRRWAGSAGWVEVGGGSASGGGVSNNGSPSFRATLAIDSTLLPAVAWADGSGANTEIYARRFNGSAWVDMGAASAAGGGVSNTPGAASDDPALARGPGGVLYLAWSDAASGNAEIYVRKWTGSVWVDVGAGSASGGGVSNTPDASFAPAIAVGADGQPVVAWEDRSGGDTEIYLKRFNGTGWVALGASAGGGGLSNNEGASLEPSLVVDAANRPVVAWTDLSGWFKAEVYVRRWTGSTWAAVGNAASAHFGGVSNSVGYSGDPALALGRDGLLSLGWSDDTSGQGEIYVRRLTPN